MLREDGIPVAGEKSKTRAGNMADMQGGLAETPLTECALSSRCSHYHLPSQCKPGVSTNVETEVVEGMLLVAT